MLKMAIVFTCISSAAFAADIPTVVVPAKPDKHDPIPGKGDPRIRTFPYDPGVTLRVRAPNIGVPVRLVFDTDEEPDAVGGQLVIPNDPAKATDWSAIGSGNTLMLQPLHAMPPSIMFITTKGSQHRNYVVELRVGTDDISNPEAENAYDQVTYTYQQTPEASADARARYQRQQNEGKVRTSLTQARFSAPRQWHYSKMGADCATMTPSGWNWISDDGHQLSLLLPPHMAGSSIYSRESDDDKDEKLITPISTTTPVGTLLVLPDVYKQLLLRQNGRKVCALRDDRYDAIGTQPGSGSGTISPDVIRVIKAQK
jgi:hypothetical protein